MSYLSSEQQLWRCVAGTLELEAIRDKLGSQQLCGPGRWWFHTQKTKMDGSDLCLSWSYPCLSMLIYMLIYMLKLLDWESLFENCSASKFPWSDWWFSAPRKIRSSAGDQGHRFPTFCSPGSAPCIQSSLATASMGHHKLCTDLAWSVNDQCKVNAKSMSQCKVNAKSIKCIRCNNWMQSNAFPKKTTCLF